MGSLVFIAYFFGWESITNFGGAVSMKPATAIGFILCGVIVTSRGLLRTSMAVVLSMMCLTIMFDAIADRATWASGITDKVNSHYQSELPGEPSIMTLVAFLVVSISAISKTFVNEFLSNGKVLIVISTVALLGYITGLSLLYYRISGVSTAMAIHTAFGFMLCGLAMTGVAK